MDGDAAVARWDAMLRQASPRSVEELRSFAPTGERGRALDAPDDAVVLDQWLRSSDPDVVAAREGLEELELPHFEGLADARGLDLLPRLVRLSAAPGTQRLIGASTYRGRPLEHVDVPNGVPAEIFAHPTVRSVRIWAERRGGAPMEHDLRGFTAATVLKAISTRALRLALPPSLEELDLTGVIDVRALPTSLRRVRLHGAAEVIPQLPAGLELLHLGALDELPEPPAVPECDMLILFVSALPPGAERARILHWNGGRGHARIVSERLARLATHQSRFESLDLGACPALREVSLLGERGLQELVLPDHEVAFVALRHTELRTLRAPTAPGRLVVSHSPHLADTGDDPDRLAPEVRTDAGLSALRAMIASPDRGTSVQAAELLRVSEDRARAMALFRRGRLERWRSRVFEDVPFWQLRHRLMMKGPFAESALLRVLGTIDDVRFAALREVPALRVREREFDLTSLVEFPALVSLALEEAADLAALARLPLERLELRTAATLDAAWVPRLQHLALVPGATLEGDLQRVPLRSIRTFDLAPLAGHPTLEEVTCPGSAPLEELRSVPRLRTLRLQGMVRRVPALSTLRHLDLEHANDHLELDPTLERLTLRNPSGALRQLPRTSIRELTIGFRPEARHLAVLARMPCLERLSVPDRPSMDPIPASLEDKLVCVG